MKINYEIDQKTSVRDYFNSFYLSKTKQRELEGHHCILKNNQSSRLDDTLNPGDILTLDTDQYERIDFIPQPMSLDILYEDDHLLIVNKPSGILVHPDDKRKGDTMCNAVAYYYARKGIKSSIKYVHRIDLETTGILIFAKDYLTKSYMDALIRERKLHREYRCICEGRFSEKKGTICLPIGEDRHHNQRRRVSKTGEEAITHYEVLQNAPHRMSFVKVTLETGRTHQIRVHFSNMHHPLAGDELYFGKKDYIQRVALHSYYVEWIDPYTHEKKSVTCPIPKDMEAILHE